MKYIAPGGWFSLEYPAGWREFEDTEESFLFYDPGKWSGNFRISAYRGADTDYGKESVSYELKENPAAELTLIEVCNRLTVWIASRKKAFGTPLIFGLLIVVIYAWNVLLR